MKIHLIAIGGAAMHNLAIALKCNHHTVSGSDDEIYDPAHSRLKDHGLLPTEMGWFPDRIQDDLDVIILGMHAKLDNPELIKAQELDLKIYSYPEYIYEHSKDKTRLVIGGSHGKTTTTAMVLHVMKKMKIDTDFLVGAQLDGFDNMVRLSDAPLMVIEGDEYLSSPIDRRPKIFHYKPQFSVITGIAWDHMNVFPTFDNYVSQFSTFIQDLKPKSKLFFYNGDPELVGISAVNNDIESNGYEAFEEVKNEHGGFVKGDDGELYLISIFGKHNYENMKAASLLCGEVGIAQSDFLNAMHDFTGAAKRLQKLEENEKLIVYQDFAHAPSKVKATVAATRNEYPGHRLVVALELHTFSSLNKDFIPQYAGSLDVADAAMVFYQDHTLKMKNLPPLDPDEVKMHFANGDLTICQESEKVEAWLIGQLSAPTVVLLMSSGTFGGLDYKALGTTLLTQKG